MTYNNNLILFCRKCKKETNHSWRLGGVICDTCLIFTSHENDIINDNRPSKYTNNKFKNDNQNA